MKKAKAQKAAKKTKRQKSTPIPAPKLLRAEAARLDVLSHAMPAAAQNWIAAQVWAYELSAAFLDSLGAPEKLQGYRPVEKGGA